MYQNPLGFSFFFLPPKRRREKLNKSDTGTKQEKDSNASWGTVGASLSFILHPLHLHPHQQPSWQLPSGSFASLYLGVHLQMD